ncbi:MAG: glycosyltransferase family 4 protein [Chloroflexi bacterium]|nr:glycosyltransferase family 4 protein [Chloroflexota bacterium]
MPQICIFPRVEGLAGPASFRLKLEEGLRARGVDVTHDLSAPADAILVLAGTKHLLPLWRAHSRGRRIVQRLDGINWVHRKRKTGIRHFLRAEYGNFILSFIRARMATRLVYQSEFSRRWWEDWYSAARVPACIIHNGVDLKVYSAGRNDIPAEDRYKLLLVEGSLGGGYEMGLENAVRLAETLQDKHTLPTELIVVGRIEDEYRQRVGANARIPIRWTGSVPRERIPEIDRSAHLLFSADLNAACPNSVIEALACGLPVLAFDTGALKELVLGDSGRVVPYGGDPWKIEPPDIPSLADAAVEILRNQPRFRRAAREQAEKNLGLDRMVEKYLEVLLG